jgi:hypothetical protein
MQIRGSNLVCAIVEESSEYHKRGGLPSGLSAFSQTAARGVDRGRLKLAGKQSQHGGTDIEKNKGKQASA